MKKLYHLHAFRQHKPTDIHNTSYDESKSSHDTDASNTGANRFGYLPLNKTHERRDKADFDNDAQELDFNCDVYGDGSMDVW